MNIFFFQFFIFLIFNLIKKKLHNTFLITKFSKLTNFNTILLKKKNKSYNKEKFQKKNSNGLTLMVFIQHHLKRKKN